MQYEVIAVTANTTIALSAMVWEKLRRDSWEVSWYFQVGWPLEYQQQSLSMTLSLSGCDSELAVDISVFCC